MESKQNFDVEIILEADTVTVLIESHSAGQRLPHSTTDYEFTGVAATGSTVVYPTVPVRIEHIEQICINYENNAIVMNCCRNLERNAHKINMSGYVWNFFPCK